MAVHRQSAAVLLIFLAVAVVVAACDRGSISGEFKADIRTGVTLTRETPSAVVELTGSFWAAPEPVAGRDLKAYVWSASPRHALDDADGYTYRWQSRDPVSGEWVDSLRDRVVTESGAVQFDYRVVLDLNSGHERASIRVEFEFGPVVDLPPNLMMSRDYATDVQLVGSVTPESAESG